MEPRGLLPHSQKATKCPYLNQMTMMMMMMMIIIIIIITTYQSNHEADPFLLYRRKIETEEDKTVCSQCVVKRFSAVRTNAYLICFADIWKCGRK